MNPHWSRFWFVLALLTLAGPASAHDPFEITTLARLRSEALQVEVTMTRGAALGLASGRHDARATFAPQAFPEYRARFEALAPSLYWVTSNGSPLRVRRRSARLTPENEVEFALSYDAPFGGQLRVDATHLRALPEGYTSTLRLVNDPNTTLGFKLLSKADPSLDVRIAGNTGFDSWLLVSVIVVGIGAFWLFGRPQKFLARLRGLT